jgi:SH3 domain-containing YSC84-like protein 1
MRMISVADIVGPGALAGRAGGRADLHRGGIRDPLTKFLRMPARAVSRVVHGAMAVRELSFRCLPAVLFAVAAALYVAPAAGQASQRVLVTSAAVTLSDFLAIPSMNWLRDNLANAKAVMIAPEVTKAGVVVGGSAGRAVVVARDPTSGRWVGPAFYALTAASVGLQVGVTVSEVVTLVMTDAGLQRLLANSFQMGSDVAIAAGPVGRSARTDLVADFVSFSRTQGAYIGIDLTGTAVASSDEWNRVYYGQRVDATDILVRQSVTNPHANQLLGLLTKATRQ